MTDVPNGGDVRPRWPESPATLPAALTVHRTLAHHGPNEFCEECPQAVCRHCGDTGPAGEDHTCPCPFSDNDCTEHPERHDGTTVFYAKPAPQPSTPAHGGDVNALMQAKEDGVRFGLALADLSKPQPLPGDVETAIREALRLPLDRAIMDYGDWREDREANAESPYDVIFARAQTECAAAVAPFIQQAREDGRREERQQVVAYLRGWMQRYRDTGWEQHRRGEHVPRDSNLSHATLIEAHALTIERGEHLTDSTEPAEAGT